MARINSQRGGCVDVFHASILKTTKYDGEYDFPVIKEEHTIPRRLIPFSKALQEKDDYRQWVCFYEDDFLFERIWNNPTRYVAKLSKFEGIVTPDLVFITTCHCQCRYGIYLEAELLEHGFSRRGFG